MAKSLVFLTFGASQTMADVLNGAVFTEEYDQMVLPYGYAKLLNRFTLW